MRSTRSVDRFIRCSSLTDLAEVLPVSRKENLKGSERRVCRASVLEADELLDDFYVSILDWSVAGPLAVGLGSKVCLRGDTNEVLCDLDNDTVASVKWTATGRHLAVGTRKGRLIVYDVETKKVVFQDSLHSKRRIGCLSWNNDLLASGGRDKNIQVRDVRENKKSFVVGRHRQEVCGIEWSPCGEFLLSGGNDNLVKVWSLSSKKPMRIYSDHVAAVKAIGWSPHRRRIFASGGGTADRTIKIYDTSQEQPLVSQDTGSQVCALKWAATANEIVSTHGYSQNHVCIWQVGQTLTSQAVLTGHTSRVLFLALSPDGSTVATASGGDHSLRFWRNCFPPKTTTALFTNKKHQRLLPGLGGNLLR